MRDFLKRGRKISTLVTSIMSDSKPLGSVLVTGGCGFLGSHIVSLLLERYATPSTHVSVLDLRTSANQYPGASYHACDITSAEHVRQVFAAVKPDIVIHTASPVFTSGAAAQALMRRVNVDGTRVLLAEARASGTTAFIYTSSASVVSDTRTDLVNADERWAVIRSPLQPEYYSDTKAEAEGLVLAANVDNFRTTALRPSAMFGERDVQLIPGLLGVVRSARTKFQLGANNNLFDFTYVGNVAHAHLLAAARLHQGLEGSAIAGEAFVITNASPVYFWDFARAVWQAYYAAAPADFAVQAPTPIGSVFGLGAEVAIMLAGVMSWVSWALRLGPPKLAPAQVRYSCMTRYFKITKAQEVLGYRPAWSLEEGIAKTTKWFVESERENRGKKSQ